MLFGLRYKFALAGCLFDWIGLFLWHLCADHSRVSRVETPKLGVSTNLSPNLGTNYKLALAERKDAHRKPPLPDG